MRGDVISRKWQKWFSLAGVSYNYEYWLLIGQSSSVQILDETDCISHSTNTLGEGMNPIILPPAMGK